MAEFAQILIRAKDETKSAFDSAARNMRGLESSAAKLSGVLGAIGIGAGLSVAGFSAFALSTINAADGLNDMSQRLGVSVKDLASFKLAAEQSGTSLDSVGKGIQKLTLSIGQAEQGLSTQAKALKTLGITSRDSKEAFFQLADAVASSNDPIKTNAALNDVLGKRYAELLPLLSQGGDALRESARQSETFAEAMSRLAPDADRFNDQLALMKINAAGLASELLVKLVPAFNDVLERIGLVKDLIGAGGLFNTVAITAGTGEISTVMRRLKDDIKETQAAIEGEKAKGKDASPFEEKLRGLNAQLEVLKKNSRDAALALGEKFKNYKVPQTPGTPRGIDLSAADKKAGGSKADPLASLLGSTDIGKLAAFDKTVAQLNARFDGGRKNTELYTQAMTKLVETTFSNNFTEFNKQLADQDETQRLVADHLKATNDALFEQQQAWADAGSALTDEMRTPLEAANIEFGRLQDLLDRGVISWETYTRAVLKTQDAISETPDKLKEMDNFAKTAAENIQNSFADFLFDPFDKGIKGMAQSFGDTIKRMIANAVAADLAKKLFGGLADNGSTSGSGLAGSALNWIGSLFGGARAEGGPVTGGVPYLVGERGPEMFVPQGSGSIVPNKAMKGGGNTYVVHVHGSNNAQDVRRAAGQGMREAVGMFEGARRYV